MGKNGEFGAFGEGREWAPLEIHQKPLLAMHLGGLGTRREAEIWCNNCLWKV